LALPPLEGLEDRALLAGAPPLATTLPATAVTATSATLNATVNPNGTSTDTLFQYSSDSTLPANVVTTLAGTPGASGSADGTGSAAQFDLPCGVAVDSAGNVYVADTVNDTIRKITPAGAVTTLAGTPGVAGSADGTGSAAQFRAPQGVAVDSAGNVYVADTGNDTIRVITPAGVVTTLAGTPGVAGSTDGTGSAARFDGPVGVAVDGAGNVYVADTQNDTIRRITPAGVVSTLAGAAGMLGFADGTGSAAQFDLPEGVAVDGAGNVYVADTVNETIRVITPGGAVTTLAGSPRMTGSADGTGAAAHFRSPAAVAVDDAGNVYVADMGNDTIREILPGGLVTTLAGSPLAAGSTDGTGNTARFSGPMGVAVDGAGIVYVADLNNDTIRKLSIPTVTAQSGVTGMSSVPVTAALGGLTPSTTYYDRVVATNAGGTTLAATLSFTTTPGPDATTQAATAITSTTATLNASVNPEGSATTVTLVYGIDPTLTAGTTATDAQAIGSGTGAVAVTAPLLGLTPGTTYYFQVVATNALGTSDGSIFSFTTPTAPDATTQAATAITSTTATLNASVNPDASATSVIFVYSTDATLMAGTTATSAQAIGSATSAVAVTAPLTGLMPDTLYYFQVVATNAVGTTNGTILSFTTEAGAPPVAMTEPATAVTATTVTLSASVNPEGSATTGALVFGTDPTLTTSTITTNALAMEAGLNVVPVTADVTGLTPDTIYYFRVEATNAVGTTDGMILSFTTAAQAGAPPDGTTQAATAITSTTATLNASVNPEGSATTITLLYGTNPTLTTGTTTTTAQAIGSGTNAVSVTADLTGLTPNTTYYFRVEATSAVGTKEGSIQSLTTSAGQAFLQFADGQFTANATDGSAQVAVTRAGDLSAAVTVVVSSPGGPDVAAFQETISFDPNATSATITVPIQNNGQPGKSDVVIPLALSSPSSGATLGATVSATLVIHDNNAFPPSVTVTSLQLPTVKVGTGTRAKSETVLRLQFSGPISGGGNLAAYQLLADKTTRIKKKTVTTFSTPVRLVSAVYSSSGSSWSVTLTPAIKLNLAQPEQLRITAALLTDAYGRPLDGNDVGQPGGNFVATFSNKGVTIPHVETLAKPNALSASAVDRLFAEGSLS